MVRFTLPLPDNLNEILLRSAEKAERSRNAHIRYILRSFLLAEGERPSYIDEAWEASKQGIVKE